uniref:Uncharacterized protein n=1 Tax=Utricularia reniformis TaxID=192314 RepID=A0A1Y0B4G7_9LAMI|nr:hypothetical protein AEK19_MT2125 [Utricularia reniformis]ART32277.1 hypothetical protein AEK19_MT2125 [Utricularia reniformis]
MCKYRLQSLHRTLCNHIFKTILSKIAYHSCLPIVVVRTIKEGRLRIILIPIGLLHLTIVVFIQ